MILTVHLDRFVILMPDVPALMMQDALQKEYFVKMIVIHIDVSAILTDVSISPAQAPVQPLKNVSVGQDAKRFLNAHPIAIAAV